MDKKSIKFDVFISYSTKDAKRAKEVCAYLEGRGLSCWIAPRNICGGKAYAREIVEGIRTAQVVVLILSVNSMASAHVENEVYIAFSQNKVVVPLRIDHAQLSTEMSVYVRETAVIDLVSDDMDSVFRKIVANLDCLSGDIAREEAIAMLVDRFGGLSLNEIESLLAEARAAEDSQENDRYHFCSPDPNLPQDNEQSFSIRQDDMGRLTFMLKGVRPGKYDNPQLLYDDHGGLMFYKNRLFSNTFAVSQDILQIVSQQQLVKIVEVRNGMLYNVYLAKVLHSSIPITPDKL